MSETTVAPETAKRARFELKRDTKATVITTVACVALSLVANAAISKIGSQIHDKIAPPATESE